MDSEVSLKVLRAISEFEEIREVWESWPGNCDFDIYSYLMFLRTNPETLRPDVLALYRSEWPDAILAGRLDDRQIAFGSA